MVILSLVNLVKLEYDTLQAKNGTQNILGFCIIITALDSNPKTQKIVGLQIWNFIKIGFSIYHTIRRDELFTVIGYYLVSTRLWFNIYGTPKSKSLQKS